MTSRASPCPPWRTGSPCARNCGCARSGRTTWSPLLGDRAHAADRPVGQPCADHPPGPPAGPPLATAPGAAALDVVCARPAAAHPGPGQPDHRGGHRARRVRRGGRARPAAAGRLARAAPGAGPGDGRAQRHPDDRGRARPGGPSAIRCSGAVTLLHPAHAAPACRPAPRELPAHPGRGPAASAPGGRRSRAPTLPFPATRWGRRRIGSARAHPARPVAARRRQRHDRPARGGLLPAAR